MGMWWWPRPRPSLLCMKWLLLGETVEFGKIYRKEQEEQDPTSSVTSSKPRSRNRWHMLLSEYMAVITELDSVCIDEIDIRSSCKIWEDFHKMIKIGTISIRAPSPYTWLESIWFRSSWYLGVGFAWSSFYGLQTPRSLNVWFVDEPTVDHIHSLALRPPFLR